MLRYEIKNIQPPADILAAMEKQMRAEREKRAVILTSEGQRDAAINTAEGEKQQVIKASEATRQQQINEAEGQAAAIRAVATATAQGMREVAAAIKTDGRHGSRAVARGRTIRRAVRTDRAEDEHRGRARERIRRRRHDRDGDEGIRRGLGAATEPAAGMTRIGGMGSGIVNRRDFVRGLGFAGGLTALPWRGSFAAERTAPAQAEPGTGAAASVGDNDPGVAGEAWREFVEVLRGCDRSFVDGGRGRFDDGEMAYAYRNLAHILSFAIELYMYGEPDSPVFLPVQNAPCEKTLGGSPDVHYSFASVRGDRRYRITGRRGDEAYLSFTLAPRRTRLGIRAVLRAAT